jgi:hypothetical protein
MFFRPLNFSKKNHHLDSAKLSLLSSQSSVFPVKFVPVSIKRIKFKAKSEEEDGCRPIHH